MFLYFISGIMGKFKGVLYVYEVIFVYVVIVCFVFDFGVDDVYWCMVDFGWVIGMFYGVLVLLVLGVI